MSASDPPSTDRIGELLERALALEAPERMTLLEEVCGDDGALREDVESLLSALTDVPPWLAMPAEGSELTQPPRSEDAEERPSSRPADSPSDDSPAPEPPTIPGYELLRMLGRGAFGEVWLARSRTGAYHAVKVLPNRSPTKLEMASLSLLERTSRGDDHLVRIRHVDRLDDAVYYVMELADDLRSADAPPSFDPEHYVPHALDRSIERYGPMSLESALRIVRELARGLEHLHRIGLLHRDVKPSNVIFVGGHAKLADVGVVARRDDHGPAILTPGFAPPEGVIDPAGDVFCLGRVLYVMLSGARGRDFPDVPPGAEPSVKRSLERVRPVLERACAKDPRQRFGSVEAFVRALDDLRSERSAISRGTLRWIGPGLVLAVLIIVGALVLGPALRGTSPPERFDVDRVVPLEISRLAVSQLVSDERGRYRMTGDLGLGAGPVLERQALTLSATLSKPAYAAVLVLPADGSGPIVCTTTTTHATPSPTTEIRCPVDPGDSWLLTEGAGLHAFVVIASETPISPETIAAAFDIEQWRAGSMRDGPLDGEPIAYLLDGDRIEPIGGARGIETIGPVIPKSVTDLAERLANPSNESWAVKGIAIPVWELSPSP